MSKRMLKLSVTIAGVFLSLLVVRAVNQHYIPSVPLGPRMILLVTVQWIMLIVPLVMMRADQVSMTSLGFSRDQLFKQIGTGLAIAFAMSLLFTVIPILLGFKDAIGSTTYTMPWQFVFEFVYKLLGIALVEELIFRGYLYKSLKEIQNTAAFAIVVSSLIFGLFHLLNGSIIQVFMTALIGAILCVCREKIRHCTLLSLIIAHGIYDGLITLWVKVL